MAINANHSDFRRLDVDNLHNKPLPEDKENETSGFVAICEQDLMGILNRGQFLEALQTLIDNAPLGVKDENCRGQHHKLIMRALGSIKPTEIGSIVSKLTLEQIDTLMKYIYKGFEQPHETTPSNLLLWHEKVYNIGGNASIVRCFTDRKRV